MLNIDCSLCFTRTAVLEVYHLLLSLKALADTKLQASLLAADMSALNRRFRHGRRLVRQLHHHPALKATGVAIVDTSPSAPRIFVI